MSYDSMTYEEFGRRFFEIAVTEERVAAAIGQIAGDEFTMGGPMAQPGKFAKVTAKVRVQDPAVTRHQGEQLTFDIQIPPRDRADHRPAHRQAALQGLRRDRPARHRDRRSPVGAGPRRRQAPPALRHLDPHHLDDAARGAGAHRRWRRREIKRFISQHVAGEIDSPESAKAKVIDIGSQIDEVWTGV